MATDVWCCSTHAGTPPDPRARGCVGAGVGRASTTASAGAALLLPVGGASSTWAASRTGGAAAAAPEDAREYAAVVWLVSGVGWSADTPLRLLVLLLDHATTMGGRSLVPATAVLLVRGMLRLCLTRASLLGSCGATGAVVMVFCDGDARHRQRRHGCVDGDDE